MSEDVSEGGRRVLGWALERLLIAFVCLDPRLMAAYQVTLSEAADDRGDRQPAVAADGGDSIGDRGRAAAGVLA
jgi:hypothetical protein